MPVKPHTPRNRSKSPENPGEFLGLSWGHGYALNENGQRQNLVHLLQYAAVAAPSGLVGVVSPLVPEAAPVNVPGSMLKPEKGLGLSTIAIYALQGLLLEIVA